MKDKRTRREFLAKSAAVGATFFAASCGSEERGSEQASVVPAQEPIYKISLAQWSLHLGLFGSDPGETYGWEEFERIVKTDDYPTVLAGDIDPLDFAAMAHRDFGIDAVEYVNIFFFDRAEDKAYMAELKKRAEDEGAHNVLIMCDAEGALGDPDEAARARAVENHYKWVTAARFLNCHSIRVNASSDPALAAPEQAKLAADGLRQLCEFSDSHNINILVENHGGLSSDASWLVEVMKLVDHPRVGTLPDFGNFEIEDGRWYDRYQGVAELMPFAKSVSAKSYDFDEAGNETATDFKKMMRIVLEAGFRGYVGIEFEGTELSEPEGILATKALLERVRDELSSEFS
jgi:sugar phosphate isomerase/epimerase